MELEGAEFRWDPANSKTALGPLTFRVPKGALIAIVGEVGAGKSSLLQVLHTSLELSLTGINSFRLSLVRCLGVQAELLSQAR